MTNFTRIVAAIVDTKQATLYKEDGNTVSILQGDVRLRPLLEQITPQLATKGYADVDLAEEQNSYKDFEEKTGGAVRFFRIAKSKLASIFGANKENATAPVNPAQYGELPQKKSVANVAGAIQATAQRVSSQMSAVDEIIKHAVPVTSADFSEKTVATQRPTEVDGKTPSDIAKDGADPHFEAHKDTIVAVTQKGNVVPGIERIKSQVTAASDKHADAKGFSRFLERVGAVAAERRHRLDDLLRFMERGDLPIAGDGTIIIYKRLSRHSKGGYTDCHTGKVLQKVGSYVHMDISLVDPNSRNECSNGLHVARRGYIRSFSGNVCVLAKVRPEDVIAVPDYDANKMRVCGYHIIAELTPEQFLAVESNRGIDTAPMGAELLAQAISGDHIGITQRVKITGHKGEGLQITDIIPDDQEPPVEDLAVQKATASKSPAAAASLEAAGVRSDTAVDPKALQALKDGTSSTLSATVKGPVTQTDVVKALWDAALGGDKAKATELLAFKKAAKKGWTVWGLPQSAGDTLKALAQD